MTVTGTNLTGITLVKFGTAAASSFTLVSATSLTAVSPAGTGSVEITVANPSYTSATGTVDQFRNQVYGSLRVSSFPSGSPSGVAQSVTVTALDTTGATYPSYTGTVTFSSSDKAATLPASYTFTAADQGSHTFQVTLNTGGTQSLSISDGAKTATQTGILRGHRLRLSDRGRRRRVRQCMGRQLLRQHPDRGPGRRSPHGPTLHRSYQQHNRSSPLMAHYRVNLLASLAIVALTGCGVGVAPTATAPVTVVNTSAPTGRFMGGQQPIGGVSLRLARDPAAAGELGFHNRARQLYTARVSLPDGLVAGLPGGYRRAADRSNSKQPCSHQQ